MGETSIGISAVARSAGRFTSRRADDASLGALHRHRHPEATALFRSRQSTVGACQMIARKVSIERTGSFLGSSPRCKERHVQRT